MSNDILHLHGMGVIGGVIGWQGNRILNAWMGILVHSVHSGITLGQTPPSCVTIWLTGVIWGSYWSVCSVLREGIMESRSVGPTLNVHIVQSLLNPCLQPGFCDSLQKYWLKTWSITEGQIEFWGLLPYPYNTNLTSRVEPWWSWDWIGAFN